ncbi:MAG: TIGR01777 family protein [Alphaproteobacteria bacterium]|nr:TIGR01777 family protein [Alphaproteobacteria bacterium]
MTLTALLILAAQTILGALDNVLHHEITERLPSKPSARRELSLHSAREGIYAVLFLIFAWVEPSGIFAAAVLALMIVEVAITIADFLEEDRTRRLPPFERVLHTVLAVLYGSFLGLTIPWLITQAAASAGVGFVSHGALSWFFTLASIGVFAFSIRNAIAVRALGKLRSANVAAAHPSGRTILVTGATGFIGAALVERLLARGDRVLVLVRDARHSRALLGAQVTHVERLDALPRETRIDAIVNLAGAPIIGLPWTRARRQQLWRSRIDLTDGLIKWIKTLDHAPAVLVNASAIGFYGDKGDAVLSETARVGEGFAADLCRVWEDAATRAEALGMRVVCLRIGLVLDATGGALPTMALPARFGLGAVFGAGHQWMSWIARPDLLRMLLAGIDDPLWHGAINATAPEPVRNADFQRALARVLNRPVFLRAPAWLLRTMLGEMSSIFLFSQRVVPSRAQALGFTFDIHFAADALSLMLGPAPEPLPQVIPALPSPPKTVQPQPSPIAMKDAAE